MRPIWDRVASRLSHHLAVIIDPVGGAVSVRVVAQHAQVVHPLAIIQEGVSHIVAGGRAADQYPVAVDRARDAASAPQCPQVVHPLFVQEEGAVRLEGARLADDMARVIHPVGDTVNVTAHRPRSLMSNPSILSAWVLPPGKRGPWPTTFPA